MQQPQQVGRVFVARDRVEGHEPKDEKEKRVKQGGEQREISELNEIELRADHLMRSPMRASLMGWDRRRTRPPQRSWCAAGDGISRKRMSFCSRRDEASSCRISPTAAE